MIELYLIKFIKIIVRFLLCIVVYHSISMINLIKYLKVISVFKIFNEGSFSDIDVSYKALY